MKKFVSLQCDFDVNRASPLEEGIDVFDFTFFMSQDDIFRFFLFYGI